MRAETTAFQIDKELTTCASCMARRDGDGLDLKLLLTAFGEALEGLPQIAVAAAFRKMREKNTFFPTPAEVRAEAERLTSEKRARYNRLREISKIPNNPPIQDDGPRPSMEQLKAIMQRSRQKVDLPQEPVRVPGGRGVRKADHWERCEEPNVTGLDEAQFTDILIYSDKTHQRYRAMQTSLTNPTLMWFEAVHDANKA